MEGLYNVKLYLNSQCGKDRFLDLHIDNEQFMKVNISNNIIIKDSLIYEGSLFDSYRLLNNDTYSDSMMDINYFENEIEFDISIPIDVTKMHKYNEDKDYSKELVFEKEIMIESVLFSKDNYIFYALMTDNDDEFSIRLKITNDNDNTITEFNNDNISIDINNKSINVNSLECENYTFSFKN